jgi:chromosome segregation ATPase
VLRARCTAERIPAYGRTIDGLRLQEQTLRQKDSALMTETDAHQKKLALIDSKIAELHTHLGMAQAEERRVGDELAMAQAAVQRAEAKLKRLDIELRSVLGPAVEPGPRRGGP